MSTDKHVEAILLDLDKVNKMRSIYNPENIAPIINKDPRFKENIK